MTDLIRVADKLLNHIVKQEYIWYLLTVE